jgi:hypothetical protein
MFEMACPFRRISELQSPLGSLNLTPRLSYMTKQIPEPKLRHRAVCGLYTHQPIKADFLWAGLCLDGALYFLFRP